VYDKHQLPWNLLWVVMRRGNSLRTLA
jgi:hypothetical protein